MVDENRVEGTARNIGEDAVGAVTGDSATQARGQMNRAAGSAQNAYGQAPRSPATMHAADTFLRSLPTRAASGQIGRDCGHCSAIPTKQRNSSCGS
jgi:uncharacterized protein YjbJ (UPF0337 family)